VDSGRCGIASRDVPDLATATATPIRTLVGIPRRGGDWRRLAAGTRRWNGHPSQT